MRLARRPRSTGRIASTAIAFSLVVAGAAAAGSVPRGDRLVVLTTRVGPFRHLEGLRTGSPVDYRNAVAAFGRPDSLQASPPIGVQGGCRITWSAAGVTLVFFVWTGSWPPRDGDPAARRIDPCAAGALSGEAGTGSRLSSVRLFGGGWHNRAGVRVDAVAPPGACAASQRVATADGPRFVALRCERDSSRRVRTIVLDLWSPLPHHRFAP